MAEVLAQFAEPVISTDRPPYRAQACGGVADNGLWEGWIEFIPLDGTAPVRSPRETTQPNRTDAVYWAGGLTQTYLEGALERALRGPISRPVQPVARPHFESSSTAVHGPVVLGRAILDPFSVYEKGELLLRRELRALAAWHLVNIVLAYELSDQPLADLNRLSQAALIDLIVSGVREQSLTP